MCNICIWVWTSYWFLDIDMLVDVGTISEVKIYIHAENVYISESELNTNSRHWHVGWYHCFAKHPVSFHDGRTKERQQVLHCSLSGNKAYVGEHPQVLLTFPVASSVISGSEFFNHAAIAWEKRESWSKSTFIRNGVQTQDTGLWSNYELNFDQKSSLKPDQIMQYGSEQGNDVQQSMKYLCFCGDDYSEIKLFLCGFGSFSPLGLVRQLMFESGPLLIPGRHSRGIRSIGS